MYLKGSKWSMRQRRPRINWFLVIVLIILIAMVTYINRVILPPTGIYIGPTLTPTRDPESYVSEAQGLFGQGKFASAIDTYMSAIRIQPDDPTLYVALARTQIYAGRYAEALTNSENALLLNPNNSMAHAVRGWALDRLKRYVEADEALKSALEIDQNNGQANAYKAFLYGDMTVDNVGPYVDPIQVAISASNAAINLAPDNLDALWARAYILQITANYEEAIQEYQKALEINPYVADIHLELGTTYRALGVVNNDVTQTNTAIEEYNLANTYNPSDYRPELYSSRALLGIAEWAKAVQYAQDAVRDDPTSAYLHGNLGLTYYKNLEFNASAEQFHLAIYGGQTQDGQVIQPLQLSGGDTWVIQYFYTYAVLLARLKSCSDVLTLTQQILGTVPDNEIAVYNANFALDFCAQIAKTPSPIPSAVPSATPTP
jgi:tetratricopeptide (TPR) repeat protein